MEEELVYRLFAAYCGSLDEEELESRLLCQAAIRRLRRLLKDPQTEAEAGEELNLLAAIWAAGDYLQLQGSEETVTVGEVEVHSTKRGEALLALRDTLMAQNAAWFTADGFHVQVV